MSDFMSGLASITKQVQQSLNSYEMRKIGDKVTGYVMNFTEAEAKVREATNEDPWGPTGPQMQEIASLTFQYDLFGEVMGMLWKRMLQENKAAWRRVYKSLILLSHLLKNGSERCIASARDHSFEMRSLESYKCLDERGKDEGANVRHRVKQILELLSDEDLLRGERRKAKHEGKEKYQGFSREEMTMGRGGGLKSSAKSNFDDWRDSSESTTRPKRFDEQGEEARERPRTGKREVTAFDFHSGDNGAGRHHSGSPELGIRDTTHQAAHQNDDDDEFGDFTEARSHAHSGGGGRGGSKLASPPPIPPPSAAAPAKLQHPTAHKQRSNDLLGLDEPAPTPTGDAGGLPGAGAAKARHATGLDDIYGSAPAPISAAGQAPQVAADLLDGLIFNSGAPQQPPLVPTHGGALGPAGPTGMDLLFGGSTESLPPPVMGSTLTASAVLNSTRQWGNNGTSYGSGGCGVMSSGGGAQETSGGVQLSKTWDDLKNFRVNIDFDTLSLRPSASKAGPSLNELQRPSGGAGGTYGPYGGDKGGMPW